ncbi:Sentrin-specific protease 7 [Sarcoptes scabiei]|uniref:Sentrin-specific protease 7 n=1 Tax=Sarcoptes scabiei TaxID=52283 RepID=A0A834RC88_SARSC|nr:Sentrin-specific protease 7 [Sarcoptes scabiei]
MTPLDARMHLISKCVYFGKTKHTISTLELVEDRIVFHNLYNPTYENRYNITVPYCDIVALRYCFNHEISIIFIHPVNSCFQKLTKFSVSSQYLTSRYKIENFITILIDENQIITNEYLENFKRSLIDPLDAKKFIKIDPKFALECLNRPNKQHLLLKNHKKDHEVIVLEDDDDANNDENVNNIGTSSDEFDILSKTILKYPENDADPIILYGKDLDCLREGFYLNDNIMNFYLKYYQLQHVSNEIFGRVHIYDALFATYLTNTAARKRKHSIDDNYCVYSFDCIPQLYHSTLKKWTKEIDIFSKDFLLMPSAKDNHWFLVIICYAWNLIPLNDGETIDSLQSKKPKIIFMDSLRTHVETGLIRRMIFEYLALELKEKRGKTLKNDCLQHFEMLNPRVPLQGNYYDCGLFVLEYIEKFLENPEKTFKMIVDNDPSLRNWFEIRTLKTKRSKIQQLILNLLPPEDARLIQQELVRIDYENDDAVVADNSDAVDDADEDDDEGYSKT